MSIQEVDEILNNLPEVEDAPLNWKWLPPEEVESFMQRPDMKGGFARSNDYAFGLLLANFDSIQNSLDTKDEAVTDFNSVAEVVDYVIERLTADSQARIGEILVDRNQWVKELKAFHADWESHRAMQASINNTL